MQIQFFISTRFLESLKHWIYRNLSERAVLFLAVGLAVLSTSYAFMNDIIVAYGDAESHLNISKRVLDSITPGFAQLGGIWLPLPHILMLPFIKFDYLWRTGLAGSVVSGLAYVVSSVFMYRFGRLLTGSTTASFIAALVFMLNPNILYLQATPMTELALIVFFILSSYYFVKFIKTPENYLYLIGAAVFGFCAALSRYDGWFLIGFEALLLVAMYFPYEDLGKSLKELTTRSDWSRWYKMEGVVVLFSTVAFMSVLLWLAWDFLILGDPLYFTHSQFSAKSQQQGWLARGQLPAYHDVSLSLAYYFVTGMNGVGFLIFLTAVAGCLYFFTDKKIKDRVYIGFLMLSVFVFYVLTLWLGQSVIFIPHLTPGTFDWTLFNVRYGVMMVPFAGVFFGYLFWRSRIGGKVLLIGIIFAQLFLYGIGYSRALSYVDGVAGLSSAKRPDAERWLRENYDHGLVLEDDFSRQVSVVRSGIPMQSLIYIGNKPYWEDSLVAPEKYARWVILQKDDTLWKAIYERQYMQDRLFKYFAKAYTSPDILIFKRNDVQAE